MSNPTELPDLLPCPFCASTKIFTGPDEYGSGGQWVMPIHVGCSDCGAEQQCEDIDDVPKVWNRRAALASRPAEVDDIPPRVTSGMVNGLAEAYERLEASQERMAKLKEKYLSPKPPRTPEEMVAFIGSHFDAMRDETSDPEDIRFTLSVHDLLSAMSDWFDDYAESAYSNEKSAEVDDEGLPPQWWYELQAAAETLDDFGAPLNAESVRAIAEQYRQGQRDAVAADRARRGANDEAVLLLREALPHISPSAVNVAIARSGPMHEAFVNTRIRKYLEQVSAPSHTTNKEK